MRRENEVLVVTKNDDGSWGYFNTHDTGDKGDIVQYLQNRREPGFNLGHCKKHLRAYAGGAFRGPMVPGMPRPVFQHAAHDLSHVARRWEGFNDIWGLPHYLEGRGISLETVKAFAPALRMDHKANILFGHTNDDGQIVGYEIKGFNFGGFAKGGVRILCRMGPLDGGVPAKIAFTESGIDALSLFQLVGRRDALYCSTGGALGPHTLDAIKALAIKHPEAEILLGFDADMAGDGYAVNIEKALKGREGVRRLMPKAKDWNDQLQLRLGMRKPEP